LAFLIEYGLFLAKVATVLVALLVFLGFIFANVQRGRPDSEGQIEVKSLNDRFEDLSLGLANSLLDPFAQKMARKEEKKRRKAEDKAAKKAAKLAAKGVGQVDHPEASDQDAVEKRCFVLEFEGDMNASAVENLREEVTAVLMVAKEHDEVVVKIESPGGVVHGYGLAASQLARIRDKNIQLTVSVDMVAASGGYMMACIANRIIAAPFALVGSVGVLAQIPNFSRLLKKNDIDVELHTAGEYKRTLTMFGENTEAGREKFRQELEEVHTLFKEFVAEHRPQVELEKIATGEAWYGKRAIDLALIDELMTSDEYLLKASQHAKVFEVKFKRPQKPIDKLLQRAARLFSERSMAYQPLLRHETEVRRGL
jgi:serine protease SohB